MKADWLTADMTPTHMTVIIMKMLVSVVKVRMWKQWHTDTIMHQSLHGQIKVQGYLIFHEGCMLMVRLHVLQLSWKVKVKDIPWWQELDVHKDNFNCSTHGNLLQLFVSYLNYDMWNRLLTADRNCTWWLGSLQVRTMHERCSCTAKIQFIIKVWRA